MIGGIFLVLRIALAASLFLFLGWAFYTLWNDLRLQARLVGQPRIPSIELATLQDDSRQAFIFSDPEVIIGRDASCDYRLEEKTISARHARVYYEMAQWWAEDLHSTNGTFLNDELVTSPMVLTSGDHLQCGEAVFEISIIPLGSSAELQNSSSIQSINDNPTSQSQSGG